MFYMPLPSVYTPFTNVYTQFLTMWLMGLVTMSNLMWISARGAR